MRLSQIVSFLVIILGWMSSFEVRAESTGLTCDFFAKTTSAALAVDTGTVDIEFCATVDGVSASTLSYEWVFIGQSEEVQTSSTSNIIHRFSSVGRAGFFTVKLTVKSLSESASVTKSDYIRIAPARIYVDSHSTGGFFPYSTKTAAAPDVSTALKAAADGSTIILSQGKYTYLPVGADDVPVLDRGVVVMGETGDPSDTIIECPKSCATKNGMMMLVDHPQAVVAGITFQGGRNESDIEMAAGVRIKNGMVSNCVVRQCFVTGSAQHAGVWVGDGLLTHTIVEENEVENIDSEHGYAANGGERREQGAYIDGSGRIDNCLFRNLMSDGGILVVTSKNAVVSNCTIVNCEVSFWTGNPVNIAQPIDKDNNPRVQWPAYAIDSDDTLKARIYNTVIFNVTRKANIEDLSRKTVWTSNWFVPFSHTAQWDANATAFIQDPGYCVNCASDGDRPINSTCTNIDASAFVDYAGGDFTPAMNGLLYNQGTGVVCGVSSTDLAGRVRVVGGRIDIGCFEQQDSGAETLDVYVDCNYAQDDSDGSQKRPYKTIKQGCENVVAGGRVFVRGGIGRKYLLGSFEDAIKLSKVNVKLLGCDKDWVPATDFIDPTNRLAQLEVEGYAAKSYDKKKSKDFDAPITIATSGCTVSGFRCEFSNESFRKDGNGGTSLIRVTASNVTNEYCWFKMIGDQGWLRDSGGTMGIISATSASASHVVIRKCYAWLRKYNCSIGLFHNLYHRTRVECCLLENLDTLFTGDSQSAISGGCEYQIVSNVFRNCSNKNNDSSGKDGWLIGDGGTAVPSGCEVAYNRVIHDHGVSGYYAFLQHGRKSNLTGDVRIHHNTIVGYDVVFDSPYKNGNQSNGAGSMWKPWICDNLIVDAGTNICESANNDRWLDYTYRSGYLKGSKFVYNAMSCAVFSGGSAKQYKWYRLRDATSLTEEGNVNLTEDPLFINTTDPLDENYYRLKAPLDPWVLQGYEEPGIPGYIGALKPQFGGFSVRVR